MHRLLRRLRMDRRVGSRLEVPARPRIGSRPSGVRAIALALLSLVLAVCTRKSEALDPTRSLKQFDHTTWTVRQGAPSQIWALAQTSDGLLWLGTDTGLFRFDGVTFEPFHPVSGPPLPQSDISALLAMPDGGLWIGFRLGGISLLRKGSLTNFTLPVGTVYTLVTDQHGVAWAGGNFEGALAKFEHGTWNIVGSELGYGSRRAMEVLFDTSGNLWVTEGTGKSWLLRAGTSAFVNTGLQVFENSGGRFAQTKDGKLWWADNHGVTALALENGLPKAEHLNYLMFGEPSQGLAAYRDGSLWYFSERGLARMASPTEVMALPSVDRPARADRYGVPDGLSGAFIFTSLEDREGNIWIATQNGLDRFRDTAFQPLLLGAAGAPQFAFGPGTGSEMFISTGGEGLATVLHDRFTLNKDHKYSAINTMYRAPDGKLWLAERGERLAYLDGDRYVPVPVPADLSIPVHVIHMMTSGPDGVLWLSVVKCPLYRYADGKWSKVASPPGYPLTPVSIFEDSSGRLWTGYIGGGIVMYQGERTQQFSASDGLTIGNVMSIYESRSNLWVAGQHGVEIFRGKRFEELRFREKYIPQGVTGIVQGDDGSLWLNSRLGVVAISGEELRQALQNPTYAVRFTIFDYRDGLAGAAPQLGPLPSAVKGGDGRLWFAAGGDVSTIDPSRVFRNTSVPPVSVVHLLADANEYALADAVSLARPVKNIEIDYAAGSLSTPERIQFKYMLDDDGKWQDAGTRRQVFLTNVPPGRHRFRVIASNGDGLWNEQGAAISFVQPPTFLQSLWFKLICLIVGVLGFASFSRLRVSRAVVRTQLSLAERLIERERIARDLHDTLLQGFQGVLLRFQTIAKRIPVETPIHLEMSDTIARADVVLAEARNKVWQLRVASRPSDDLAEYLRAAAKELSVQWSANVSVEVTGVPRPLHADVFDEVGAIAQEALANAFQHSGGSEIQARLDFGKSEMTVAVSDDGRGIKPQDQERKEGSRHWGLVGMQERAQKIGARLSIGSRLQGGAEVKVAVPASVAYRSLQPRWKTLFRGATA